MKFYFPGRVAFEKLTDLDYKGETYYTIRNLSLYECQGWCREEPECQAASFSFAVNPLSATGKQETVCLLQNATQANNPAAKPAKALSQYYMVKMSIRSGRRKRKCKDSNSYSYSVHLWGLCLKFNSCQILKQILTGELPFIRVVKLHDGWSF